MKNILLLTDFTQKSENAQNYALKLFTGQQCRFYIFSIQKLWDYTMDDLMTAGPEDSLDQALLGDNRTGLRATKAQLISQSTHEDFEFHNILDYAVFTNAIENAVNTHHIDLIVCGTDGKSGIVEAIFSSHTLRIIRRTDIPVLAIPEGFIFKKPNHIQYLLDYDDVFETCGKELLFDILKSYQSHIHVMRFNYDYVIEPLDYEKEHEDFIKYFKGTPVTYKTHPDEDLITIIKKYLDTSPTQLQVLSVHEESFLERLFLNSHLSKIVNSASIPLLILRDCTP